MFAMSRAAVRHSCAAARQTGASRAGAVRLYHENIVEHYENPRNVGSLNKKDLDVGTGLVGAPACGDVMKLQIKVRINFNSAWYEFVHFHFAGLWSDTINMHVCLTQVDSNGVITETKFKTFGCGSAIASSSVATEWLKGKTVDESLLIRNTDIAAHLKLPPVKLHCSMLAEDAIKAAIKDYQSKKLAAAGSA
jgi:iron-sulfur cluster assembly enzyme ISCU, mitochondrial